MPTVPNAEYLFSRAENDVWDPRINAEPAEAPPRQIADRDRVLPGIEAGLPVYAPHWNSQFCLLPDQARATRRRVLEHCAETGRWSFPRISGRRTSPPSRPGRRLFRRDSCRGESVGRREGR